MRISGCRSLAVLLVEDLAEKEKEPNIFNIKGIPKSEGLWPNCFSVPTLTTYNNLVNAFPCFINSKTVPFQQIVSYCALLITLDM